MTADDDRQYGHPLPGPLDVEPSVTAAEADEMVRIGLRHVGPLGACDRRMGAWLRVKDPAVTATIASWLARAWQQGMAAGQAELTDEIVHRAAVLGAMDRVPDLVEQITACRRETAALAAEIEASRRWLAERYTTGGTR